MNVTFTETFYMFLVTSGIGFLLAIMKGVYKSKCKEVSCCCIKIVRDVEAEEKIDELVIQNHGTSSRDEKENNV